MWSSFSETVLRPSVCLSVHLSHAAAVGLLHGPDEQEILIDCCMASRLAVSSMQPLDVGSVALSADVAS